MNPGTARRRRRGRWLIAAGVVTAIAAAGVVAIRAALGGRATGARLQRMKKSPEWQGSHFENPQPIVNDTWAALVTLFRTDPNVKPKARPSTASVEPARFAAPPSSGLRVTWLGHSTVLLEIDGHRFLTDPVWSERIGPVDFTGPKRWFPPLIALRDLPPLDAILLSHDHYDHLDYETIVAITHKCRNLPSSLRSVWVHTSNVGAFRRRRSSSSTGGTRASSEI
jgi:hypothetical protein